MANLYRVGVDWSGGGVFGGGRSTHYFLASGGTAQQAATAVGTFWGAVDAFICNTARWDLDQEIQTIDEATGLIVATEFVTASGANGTDASAQLPPTCQGLVQWRTAAVVAGRTLRGRTFVPAAPEGQNDATGLPSSTYQSALDTAGEAMVSDGNTVLVVYSKTHGTHGVVTGSTVWNKWGSLRSRRD